jgi:hypothetical protein
MLVLFLAVYFFSCLPLSVVSEISSSYVHGIPENQYNALEDFYNATNGAFWKWDVARASRNFTMWNFTTRANPCSDNWQGLLCNCTGLEQTHCTISRISLPGYNLSGSIPNSFDAFTDLIQLTLQNNSIRDPFPDSFQRLQNLTILEMGSNLLRKFPTITLCRSLTYIDLSHNQLSSSLPSSISGLSLLSRFDLNNNFMNGTLPVEMWNLTQITELHLSDNFFTGTISSLISQLTRLRRFVLSYNYFFGAFPDSFPVSELDYFNIASNYFSQTIPANFQNAHFLEDLYLYSNGFSGDFHLGNHIPTLANIQLNDNFFVGNLTYLQNYNEMAFLFLNDNTFTGSLPFSYWRVLLVYEASNNYFTGSFPSLYSNLSFLEEINIGNNFLTGSLITSTTLFGILLTGFNISYNLFTGAIPVIGSNNKRILDYYTGNVSLSVINATDQVDVALQTFMVNNNFFSGPLPDVVCLFSQLSLISFSNNQLTGPIPFNYSLLNVANQFTVGNNKLNGPIGSVLSVFNSSKLLNVLDLSGNEFTGTIPDDTNTDFYEANAVTLQVLNLGINCLSGTLPEALCQLSNLRTLILDGLTSSPSCVLFLFPTIPGLNAFVHKNKFYGSIPSCLLEIPGLQTFHSSGNGIKGNLLPSLNVSDSLTDLCLSHNELTGTIPLSIQEKLNWQTLDLSYNRLSGTLSTLFYPFPGNNGNSSEITLSLEINHLSGNIPSSLLATSSSTGMSSLSILEGNIFNCGSDKSRNLPNNDQHYQNYDCASSTSTLLIVVSSLLTGLCVFCICVVLLPWKNPLTLRFHRFLQQIKNWKDAFNSPNAAVENSSSFYLLKDYLSNMIKLTLLMMFFAVVVAQPTWIGISSIYGTYELQYVWSVAAIFMSGQTPALVLLMLFVLWFSLFFYTVETQFIISSSSSEKVTNNNDLSVKAAYKLKNPRLMYYVYFLVFIVDACIMLGVDVIFVVCTLNLSSNILIVILMIIAVLRLFINNVLVWKLVPVFSTIVERIYLKSTGQSTLPIMRKRRKRTVEMDQCNAMNNGERAEEELKELKDIYLFNFMNEEFLVGKILILNNILYPVLAVIIILPDCFYYAFVQPSTVTSSFSYLSCSVYSFTFCIPSSIDVVTETTSFIPPFGYTYLCAANIITYYISLFFLAFFFSAIGIPLLKLSLKFIYDKTVPEYPEELKNDRETVATKASLRQLTTFQKIVLVLVPNRFRHYCPQKDKNQSIQFIFCGQSYVYRLKSLPISNWKKFVCQVHGDLTILFSFGVLFPPLMVFGGICLIGIICYEFLTLGKVLYETRQLNYSWYETELLNESQKLLKVFRSNTYWTMVISCLLLGFIVFDTWGIEKGWQYGIIGFFTLNIIPLCSFSLYYWFRKKLKPQIRSRATTTTVEIEVSSFKNIPPRKSQEDVATDVDNPLCHNI